ncbi:MAG: Omp28-related outer membrane protein [Bacteroidia bacterium]|nr:Omp28-related outer membrane protein [Bacteroidia bacterium]
MSTFNKKLAILVTYTATMFSSCDKVNNPIIVKGGSIGSKFITKNNSTKSNYKKVLIEDFTGQRCPNCPDAALIVETNLIPRYGDTLVAIAVHAGSLSDPFGSVFKNQDFRTPAGTAWNGASEGFGITTWPTGLVNRKDYSPNGLLLGASKWTTVVPVALKDPFIVKLDLTTEYDTTARALNTYVKATFKQAYSKATKLLALFIEDGIVGVQDDKGVDIEDYEFEHMLRGTINGNWGSDLTTSSKLANDTVRVSFPNFALPDSINVGINSATGQKVAKGKLVNDKKVSVIVFAYDAVSKEVLQVEKVKIR